MKFDWLRKGRLICGDARTACSMPITLVDYHERLGANCLFVLFDEGRGFEDQRPDFERVSEICSLAHERGMHVIGRTSMLSIHWTSLLREEPEALEWTMRDSDGRVTIYSGFQPARLNGCPNNPNWRAYHHRVLAKASDIGLDGVYFDNCTIRPYRNRECFCSYCRDAFREFTARLAGESLELDEQVFRVPSRENRFLHLFIYETLSKTLADMVSFAHGLERPLAISVNCFGYLGNIEGLDLARAVAVTDFLLIENGWNLTRPGDVVHSAKFESVESLPFLPERPFHNQMSLKLTTRMAGHKPVVMVAYMPQGWLPKPQYICTALAECAATGAHLVHGATFGSAPVPVDRPVWDCRERAFIQQVGWQVWYEASWLRTYPEEATALLKKGKTLDQTLEIISRKYGEKFVEPVREMTMFLASNADLLDEEAEPAGGIGVLQTLATRDWVWRGQLDEEYLGICQCLLETHFPFECVEDSGLQDSRLKAFGLLILPSVCCLSCTQRETLSKYLRQGGRMLLLGPCGTMDEMGEPYNQDLVQYLKRAGGDKVVHVRESPGHTFWRTGNSSTVESVLEHVSRMAPKEISIEAPRNVYANIFRKGEELQIRLVRYFGSDDARVRIRLAALPKLARWLRPGMEPLNLRPESEIEVALPGALGILLIEGQ